MDFLGYINPILTGIVGFFFLRYISQNDKFQDSTEKRLGTISEKIIRFEENITTILEAMNNNVLEARLDASTRMELVKLKKEIETYSDLLSNKLEKTISKMDVNFGKVVWIDDYKEVNESQEKKIMGLYEILKKLSLKNKQGL